MENFHSIIQDNSNGRSRRYCEGRSAAVAERTEDGDSDALNHAHSDWFPDVRCRAQHFTRSHKHSRVNRWNGKARTSTFRWRDSCRLGVGYARKLGDGRISARAHSSNDSFTFLLWKYGVGIHFHILHLQVFTCDDSQNHEVDQEKEIQFSHSLKLIVINTFIAQRRNKQ